MSKIRDWVMDVAHSFWYGRDTAPRGVALYCDAINTPKSPAVTVETESLARPSADVVRCVCLSDIHECEADISVCHTLQIPHSLVPSTITIPFLILGFTITSAILFNRPLKGTPYMAPTCLSFEHSRLICIRHQPSSFVMMKIVSAVENTFLGPKLSRGLPI